ncbi:hypothetical protein JXA27_08660 [Aerococcaceae bacterium zg-B36]|uniref:hypothetical protein n=1 Tax=Aerococcaceae bacterium zg-252 TaxID=2796928 RepID=UPI001BD8A22B|nr:hypothetical protein [Aerococcaceae bacterium zg-B36]
MKIERITQAPFETIISLDKKEGVRDSIGNFFTVDGVTLHQIKGTSTEFWTEFLIEKTDKLEVDQEIKFMKIT